MQKMLQSVKQLIKKIVFNRFTAQLLLRPVLHLHNLTYMLSGMYAFILNNGVHPKYKIVQYENWFLDHIDRHCNILDIGCNTGKLAFSLSQKANKVYGIEIVTELFEKARQINKNHNIEYINADATDFNYSQCDPINCVVLSNVLEHIENRVEFLQRIQQKVNWHHKDKKKIFLIRVPAMDRDWITIYKKQIGLEWRLDRTHFTEYTLQTFREEMRNSGLEILTIDVKFGEFYAVCSSN